MKLVLDNKKFWKTINPLFSDKNYISKKIVLIEGDTILSDDLKVAETFNKYFANIVSNLKIKTYPADKSIADLDSIYNIIKKFQSHPSILKIKECVVIGDKFTFKATDVASMSTKISNLNIKKPTTFNCMPVKIIVENRDICAPHIVNMFNDSVLCGIFPSSLKKADITPGHKKLDTTNKDNYRPVSILPCISKLFERTMEEQILIYMQDYLNKYLCGFRKGYSSQHCLLALVESWRKALDKRHLAAALLTDLSKAFDCINHELLIAKLDAYGFDHASLTYIYSYLTGRQHRTEVNNSFSSWADIHTGVPQGSILGPPIFNIYINDIFFFTLGKLANYADDNTPYVINKHLHSLLHNIVKETTILVKWFEENYFKMNPDKYHLLVTNHSEDISIKIGGETIKGSNSVKLLGVNLDNKLDFNDHVSKICGTVSFKTTCICADITFYE